MMPTSDAISRRATGIWRLRGIDQDKDVEKESLAIEQPTSASDSAFNYDHVDGSFEFGGIRVRLVTYKSIPGVIQINASKTISEWNTLRILKHINIVGFNDNNPSISHWLPTNADDPSVVPLRIFPPYDPILDGSSSCVQQAAWCVFHEVIRSAQNVVQDQRILNSLISSFLAFLTKLPSMIPCR